MDRWETGLTAWSTNIDPFCFGFTDRVDGHYLGPHEEPELIFPIRFDLLALMFVITAVSPGGVEVEASESAAFTNSF